MKRILSFLLLLVSAGANAQFVPGQVLTAAELNSQFALYAPLGGAVFSGSVSIPALTVTGTATFPSGTIALSGLASQAANTVVANFTASGHTPVAFAMPSCSTATSALQYTSGTGVTCNTNAASLTGATFTGAVSLSYAGPIFTLNDTSGSGFPGTVYKNNGTQNWALHATSSSNAFALDRYVAGVFTDSPISVSNSTGAVTMADGVTGSPISGSTGSFTTLAASSTSTFGGNMTLNTGGSNPLFAIVSGGTTIDLVNNSSNSTYGLFNATSSHGGVICAYVTDVCTFFARPVFGSATPWDSANLAFATPPAIGGTTPGTGKFTTLQATSTITPSSIAGIVGTTTNDSAQAGSVGETITATATGVAQTSATLTNVTSIPLTAGDWDVTCSWTGTAATSTTGLNFGLTTTTGAQAPIGQRVLLTGIASAAGTEMSCPSFPLKLASSATLFLTSAPTFTGSMTVGGTIWARRRR